MLEDRRHRLIIALTGILLFGAIYGIMHFSNQTPASMTLFVFTAAAFFAAGFLFVRKSFYSATLVGITSFTLFAATLIITEFTKLEFSTTFPDVVFYEPVKSQALHALLTFVCLFAAFVLWYSPSGWAWGKPSVTEISFSKSLWGIFLAAALGIALLNTRGEFVFQAAYHSAEWLENQGETYAMLDALWIMLGICSLTATLRAYGPRHKYFRFVLITLILSILYFKLLRGERSTAFGFLIFLALLYYTVSTFKWKGAIILACMPAAFVFLVAWANVRSAASEKGLWRAFAEGSASTVTDIREGFVDKLDRFPKITWDMLETTFLYENGIQRRGETYLNLIPQTLPLPLAEIIGYERPLGESWMLAIYFDHGGGIFAVAEAYWNFGLPGVIGFALVLSAICVAVETFYRKVPPVLGYGYYGVIQLGAETVLSGIQPFVRGLEIAMLITLIGWALLEISRGRAPRS